MAVTFIKIISQGTNTEVSININHIVSYESIGNKKGVRIDTVGYTYESIPEQDIHWFEKTLQLLRTINT